MYTSSQLDEAILVAVETFGRYERQRFQQGLAEVLNRFPGMSYGSLRTAFQRRGLKAPTSYCRRADDVDVDLSDLTPTPVLRVPQMDSDTEPAPPLEEQEALPDRSYIEKPDPTYVYNALDCGSELERILLLPDTHAPYHDRRAWDAVMRFAKQWQPHTVVHVGDWIDCYTVSDHDKDPRRATQLESELRSMHAQREEIEALPGIQRQIIALGNHEYRIEREVMRKLPALLSLVDVAGLMGLEKWNVIPYLSHGKIGKLNITHGADHSGAYAMHQHGTTFAASVAFGHTHRMGLTYFGDADNNRHVSINLGWLGSPPSASYLSAVRKRRYWQHGFGIATMRNDGRFQANLMPIIDGELIG